MFNWSVFNSRKDFYSGAFAENYSHDHDHHHVQVDARNLNRYMEILRHDMGFILLVDVVAIRVKDHPHFVKHFPHVIWDVTYHLFHLEAHQRLQVHLLLKEGEVIPSVLKWFPSSEALEKEAMTKISGVVYKSQNLTLPKPRTNPNLSESPYPEELSQWYLYDINHPLTKNQWELAVESKDGKVLQAWLSSGHWKKEIEAKVCAKSFFSTSSLLDQLVPDSSLMVNVTWSKTVEDYFLIKIPERAQAVRMVFIEISRVYHHLGVLKRIAQDLELPDPAQLCVELREHIKFLVSYYSARRLSLGQAFFGGLSHDLPSGWTQEVSSFVQSLEKGLWLYHKMVALHPLARMRLKGGSISAQDALNAGTTGPSLRAAGVNFDLRKSRPFYFYQEMNFDVPVGINGDSHDRMLVFYEECHQSIKILHQLLDNLPVGAFQSESDLVVTLNDPHLTLQDWGQMISSAKRVWCSQYTAIEGPNGELGFHLMLHPADMNIYGFKIKSNSLLMSQTLNLFLQQCPLINLAPTLSSLDINSSLLDR